MDLFAISRALSYGVSTSRVGVGSLVLARLGNLVLYHLTGHETLLSDLIL